MLLHLDASRHAWLPGQPHDLVSVSDDATNEVYYARLVREEDTREVLRALAAVVATHGLFCALYTDRESLHAYAHGGPGEGPNPGGAGAAATGH